MTDFTLYLFDGHNVLHAGDFRDHQELVDRLADFLALRGARGIVVFDGPGDDRVVGPLEVRYAPHADTLLERLAALHRGRERVCLVSSDTSVRRAVGLDVQGRSSRSFLAELEVPRRQAQERSPLADRLDADTRAALERLRRGQDEV